jgi:hypothetical protein
MMVEYPSFSLFSTLRSRLMGGVMDYEQWERRELSVWLETLVNRKIMPDKEYRQNEIQKRRFRRPLGGAMADSAMEA